MFGLRDVTLMHTEHVMLPLVHTERVKRNVG